MTHEKLLAKIDSTKTLGNGRANELKQALQAVVEKASKERAYKDEVDEFYIKGWNAAMKRILVIIERELS